MTNEKSILWVIEQISNMVFAHIFHVSSSQEIKSQGLNTPFEM